MEFTREDLHGLAAKLHEAADETDNAADHDEYHAAGAVIQLIEGESFSYDYIARWIAELRRRAGLP